MDQKETIELKILEEIEKQGTFTQRDLSKKLRIALGLSNAYIRRLIEKGYVMVSNMPKKRVFYNLTPKGILEKSRLTLLYMRDSLDYYRALREKISATLQALSDAGAGRVVILGTGEIAEIVFLMTRQVGMELVAVVEISPKIEHFLGLEVFGVQRLQKNDYDAIIVAEEVFGDTAPLARLISDLDLPTEKMVLFSGHRLRPVAGLEIQPPQPIHENPEEGK